VKTRSDADAFVIACYSDPGIDACRSITSQPVFGIQESGVLTALSRAELFGVIAIADASVERHRRYLSRMQVLNRLAGEIALNISVDESANGAETYQRLVEVGYQLIEMGAGVIVLGCAGMSRHRLELEAELRIPVIDPTQAAVCTAIGTILAN
jgi:Asp/Glu/hydantoin racemase